jgi:hypothetical protein
MKTLGYMSNQEAAIVLQKPQKTKAMLRYLFE